MKLARIALAGALIGALTLSHAQVGAEDYPTAVTTQTSQRTYRPGEIIRPTYSSKTGKKLSFELPGLARGLILTEVAPGDYEGSLMVLPSMAPYQGELIVRELGSGRVLSRAPLELKAGPVRRIQASASKGEICFAFDETIRAHTVEVTIGDETHHYPEDIEVKSNFFRCDTPDTRFVTVKAQAIDGELLERKLTVDTL